MQKPQFWIGKTGASLGAEDLARAALERLAAGDAAAAFALADRRCRLLVPGARDFLLRAEAHRISGRLDAAQKDLAAAILLDPTDPVLDSAALNWGDERQRRAAAQRVVDRRSGSWRLKRQAVVALLSTGSCCAHGLARQGRFVSGWVAWNGAASFRIAMSGVATGVFDVEPDLGHPLAEGGVQAAEVAIEAPESGPLSLKLTSADGASQSVTLRARAPGPSAPPVAMTDDAALVTVIVPVYEDLEATRACLDSLAQARRDFACRVVVVDDATPNAELADLLETRAAAGDFELVRNTENLGFAAAVNIGLARRGRGDALLLNADTLLPPGVLARLHAVSRAGDAIGTVTPFSNNGELTSYPKRNVANPLPSGEAIAALDRAARAVNGNALVEMPNGVGFCLYVTAACLAQVGPLPEIYAEGYYEDVEFCLRAREKGFRNVAAPGVFVGHAGSRSFTTRKQALVMRNLALIEARFPGYRLETAAFVARDPLASYRAALDAALPPPGPVRLIVCGPGDAATAARRRSREPSSEAAMIVQFDARGAASLCATGDGAPQSLRFDADATGLADYLGRAEVSRVEWIDPAAAPDAAAAAILALGAPIDILCGELAWFAPPPAPSAGPCAVAGDRKPCAACRDTAPNAEELERQAWRRPRLARALERAERIVPLDALAERFASRVFKARAVPFDGLRPPERRRAGPLFTLGALYPYPTAGGDRLLARLGRRLAHGEGRLVVLGGALDDAQILATGAAFVTGRVDIEERADVARHCGVDGLLAPNRGGGYGDAAALATALAAPMAFFDWSFGAFTGERGDLSLDPRICDDKAAEAIAGWMEGEGF